MFYLFLIIFSIFCYLLSMLNCHWILRNTLLHCMHSNRSYDSAVYKRFFTRRQRYPADLRCMYIVIHNICVHAYIFRVKSFRDVSFSFSQQRSNRNSSTACVGAIHHSYIPESHIGFWSSGYDGFWRATSLPRLTPGLSAALFIVTSHLCMNPRDSIVRNTWRTTSGAGENASCFLSGSR